MLRLIEAADVPARLVPRSGANVPWLLAAASVWHEPQPCAIQTASPSACAEGAVVAAGALVGRDPSPSLVHETTTLAAAASTRAPAIAVAILTPRARAPAAERRRRGAGDPARARRPRARAPRPRPTASRPRS